jgi:competence protein ComEC
MRPSVTPLLPWQILFVCAVCGILALRAPQAAVASLLATMLLARIAEAGRATLFLAPAAFLMGLGAAVIALPDLPGRIPREVLTGKRAVLVGTIDSVTPRTGDRLTVILRDVRLARPAPDAAGESGPAPPAPLPGLLQVTWDHPAFRPDAGDVLAMAATVRPVTGFRNPGGYDTVFARRAEGVFFRTFIRGDQAALIEAAKSPWRGLRETVRQGVLRAVAPPAATDGADDSGDAAATPAPGAGAGPERGTPGRDAPGKDAPDRNARHGAQATTPPPAPTVGGAMLLALLTGDTSALTNQDMDLVRRASLAHALALSGMHVGYVAAMAWLFVWLIGRAFPAIHLRLPRQKIVVLLAAPLAAGYVWLGGFSPSLVRAALMFGCFGALILLDRPRILLDGLFLALAIIVAASPLSVFDIRLQLSALAVAGLAAFWPLGRTLFDRLPLPEALRPAGLWAFGLLWTSLAALAAILPVLALEFGEISPHVYLNLLWLPVLGFVVMPLGLAGLTAAAVSPDAAAFFYVPAAWVCDWLMGLLAWQDGLGLLGVITALRPLWPEIVGYFVLCAALVLWWREGVARPGRILVLAVGFVLAAAPAVRQAGRDLSGEVRLTMLDVGQGQALVAEFPGGGRILVDGGGLGIGDFDMGRAVTGPALTYGRSPELAGVILTHGHSDHSQGLAWPLSRFEVGSFAVSASPAAGVPDAALARALADSGLTPRRLAAGDRLEAEGGAVLEVLHPPADFAGKTNDASVVLRLVKDGRGLALLCGDIEKMAIRSLLASGRDLSAEVLVLPHHGSASSQSRAFYRAVAPRAAFISCGEGNRFHYPSDKVLAELSRLGCPVYVTAARGAVTATWTGDGPAQITAFDNPAPPQQTRPAASRPPSPTLSR